MRSAGLLLLLCMLHTVRVDAAPVRAAVASNFQPAQEALAEAFEAASGHTVESTYSSTGKLHAQILHGAPFDVFLAADAAHPEALVKQGLTAADSCFTYAVGRLALCTAVESVRDPKAALEQGAFTHLAVAKADLAPYGAAAMQVLSKLGLTEAVRNKLVFGESISQAWQFTRSGAAELGFVACSQVVHEEEVRYWLVPGDQHEPIEQQAVLLLSAREHLAARAYLEFLKSPEAAEILQRFGYALPEKAQPDPPRE